MGLKYIDFISGSTFDSGVLQRLSETVVRYVSFSRGGGGTAIKVYTVTPTALSLFQNSSYLGTANTFIGNDKGISTTYYGGEYVNRFTRIFNGTYQNTITAPFVSDYLGYHGVKTVNYGFDGHYVVYIYSDTNKSGIVSYREIFSNTSGGISYYYVSYRDNLDYSSTLSNPGTQLNANSLINVNGYLIGGFVDVGLMSFSLSTSGILTQKDRISGGTNNYIQSVVNYGNYIYYTSAGSNSIALQRCELTGSGTFSNNTTIVNTGTTAAAITIKGKYLYYGSQMKLHKYEINPTNGNLTHLVTYNLSTTYFTNAIIRDISIDTDTDYMVIETTEGRALLLESNDPIAAGSKNRVIFMM